MHFRFDHFPQSTWSCHQYSRVTLKDSVLLLFTHAANYTSYADLWLSDGFQVLHDLHGQLSRGSNDQTLDDSLHTCTLHHLRYYWNTKGQRLARSLHSRGKFYCLTSDDEVFETLVGLDYLLLDLSGGYKPFS